MQMIHTQHKIKSERKERALIAANLTANISKEFKVRKEVDKNLILAIPISKL